MSEWNAKITRVDQPQPGLLSLSYRTPGRNEVLILVTLPGHLEPGIIDARPRGAVAGPSTTQLRRHLEGMRIEGVEASRRAILVSLARGDARRSLIATAARPYGAWWLCEADGAITLRSPGAGGSPPSEAAYFSALEPSVLRDQGPRALDAHEEGRVAQLQRALRRHVKRVQKKRDAIAADLARAEEAGELQEKASLLLAHASEIDPEATSFEAASWEDPERRVRIELDPTKSPAELAQALFARAKRLRRGLDVAPARLAAIEDELARVRALASPPAAPSSRELSDTLQELGVGIEEPKERERKRQRGSARRPYRAFETTGGALILVGRGASENDQLTLRVARPHDLWLHARGATGAHVVVPLDKGKACPSTTLVDAATLAAHFSDLRGEPIVDVLYTPRRFVRKRKGAPVGSVTLERERVIAVRIEPDRLNRLLSNERPRR